MTVAPSQRGISPVHAASIDIGHVAALVSTESQRQGRGFSKPAKRLNVRRQSRKSSLIAVLARVFSSTRLTMTAQ